ncbi:MAG: TrkH family potassium uptake protein [Thermoplasmata archaeon]
MRWKVVFGNLGSILKLFGFAFYVPVIPALYYFEEPLAFGFLPLNALIFLFMANLTITIGYPLEAFGKAEDFHHHEAVVIVSSSWLILALISSVPFLLSGILSSPIDGFFEAMSGMTTTGATVFPYPLEQHPKSIMMWRALLQWIGGMGVIVLSVAILSKLSSGGLSLLEAEAPGPSITRLKPKIMETAKILWYIYGLLTLCQTILLMGAGLSLYDAVYHSFTTMSTGGFSNYTGSVGHFGSPVQWIIIVFMLMGGINFSLHYQAFKGNFKKVLDNEEFRTYMGLLIGTISVITFLLIGTGILPIDSLRYAMFQVVSLSTSTGYATANYDSWPNVARMVILLLMVVGATAGSTGGGIKVLRILLVFKMVGRSFKEFINPRRVMVVRMNDKVVDENVLKMITMFFMAYIIIMAIGSLLLVASGMDLLTSISGVISALSNVGPALAGLGPDFNFRVVSPAGRLLLSILMWIGRLEIFTAVVLFSPDLYKRKFLGSILKFKGKLPG